MRLLSIYISVNRWTPKEKGKSKREDQSPRRIQGNIEYDASSQGSDFSLGGDDEIDVDSCGK